MKKKRFLRYRQVGTLAKDFIGNRISAAGLSYVVTSKTTKRRTLWSIVLLATLCLMGYMTYRVIQEYLGFPKLVMKEDFISTSLTFPAVTVCSLNPIVGKQLEKSTFSGLKKLDDLFNISTALHERSRERDACNVNPMCRWSWFTESCFCVQSPCLTEFCITRNDKECFCASIMCASDDPAMTGACQNFTTSKGMIRCVCDMKFKYSKATTTTNRTQFEEVLKVVSDQQVKDLITLITESAVDDLMDIEEDLVPTARDIFNYGTQFDQFVISCSFEGIRCDKENFTILYDLRYGKCYMFNYVGESGSSAEKALSIHDYGSASGLQILMQLENSNIVDLLTREIGVRVVVHDPHELPFVSEHGVNIGLNEVTGVELGLQQIVRLGYPWGDCTNDNSRLNFDYSDIPYHQLGCQKRCRDYYVGNSCNCTKRSFLRSKVTMTGKDYRLHFCRSRNETELHCMKKIINAIEGNEIRCNCLPRCSEEIYQKSVSSSKINDGFYEKVKAVRTLVAKGNGTQHFRAKYRRDMAGLKVFFKTLQVDRSVEVPSYSWESLLANIGGNMGFFMGLSIVTFLEVVEFIWDAMLSLVKCKWIRRLQRTKVKRVPKRNFPEPIPTSAIYSTQLSRFQTRRDEGDEENNDRFQNGRSPDFMTSDLTHFERGH